MARNLYTCGVRVSFDHLMLAVGVFESCDAIKGLWDGVVVHVLNGNRESMKYTVAEVKYEPWT